MNREPALISFAIAVSLAASAAIGQGPPDYGMDWATIGDPGNQPALPSDYQFLNGPVGSVGYDYRLTRTEVTNAQFLPFVEAYVHFNPSALFDPGLSGYTIYQTTNDPANPGWMIRPGAEQAPATMSWQYAARLCNWLQNGKAYTAVAFASGVYDTSTFVHNPDGTWSGQATHAPGANYWIPSYDEWTKGVHYDPNKNGPGQSGYWLYPYMSDTMLPGGPPGTPGAYTSAGLYDYPGPRIFPVGSYPNAHSPWGLLDGSGGESEWLDGGTSDGDRRTAGSNSENQYPFLSDRLDFTDLWSPDVSFGGIRLASTIPTTGTLVVLAPIYFFAQRRKRS